MNGLRLDNGADALAGGYSGKAIQPGKPEESLLLKRITSTKKGEQMPPNGPPLAAEEVAALRSWIAEGAKWPDNGKPRVRRKSTHWAFQPLALPALPDLSAAPAAWRNNPIDAFVWARLQKEGLTPSPAAEATTLLRRLKLDLLGLPPTPDEVQAFLADKRPDAYARWVDQFLASPHYGERWARQWLDLARYADSDGFEKDQVRPHAWRWRQWVIDALNADMPFDQFSLEQIAGDLLPNATIDQQVATGFHRNVLVNREAGVDRAEARYEQLVNRVNTVGTTWLGLTMGCSQCHDHKYDPISQREYYQMMAVFNGADDKDIDAPLPGELGPYRRALPEYRKQRLAVEQQYGLIPHLRQWEAKMREAWANPGKDPNFDFWVTSMSAMVDHAKRLVHTPAEQRSEKDHIRLMNYWVANPGPEVGRDKALKDKIAEARKKLADIDAGFPSLTQAYVLTPHPEKPQTYITLRGDYRALGIPVQEGTLEVLHPLQQNPGEPARLAFARWIASKENPLTPRVTVNRAWQEFFGRGLVRTSEDFGRQGDKPSHPELLDYLAKSFVDGGMRLKSLHRQIVLSATYRQSSQGRPELQSKDPENILLARQSRLRLSAEAIRDASLLSSGILNPVVGGPSFRPYLPKGVAELGYGNSVKWAESQGKERYRRGLYIHFQRTTPYPQLINFDAPDSNVACSRRKPSNNALQALNLLNDPVFNEAAQALAQELLAELPQASVTARVDRLFLRALGRTPSDAERSALARYLDRQADLLRQEGRAPAEIPDQLWAGAARVLLNTDEFITRE